MAVRAANSTVRTVVIVMMVCVAVMPMVVPHAMRDARTGCIAHNPAGDCADRPAHKSARSRAHGAVA
jgi:hypothetical protein